MFQDFVAITLRVMMPATVWKTWTVYSRNRASVFVQRDTGFITAERDGYGGAALHPLQT